MLFVLAGGGGGGGGVEGGGELLRCERCTRFPDLGQGHSRILYEADLMLLSTVPILSLSAADLVRPGVLRVLFQRGTKRTFQQLALFLRTLIALELVVSSWSLPTLQYAAQKPDVHSMLNKPYSVRCSHMKTIHSWVRTRCVS